MASAGWYAAWIRACINGSEDPEGEANRKLGVKGKDFARCIIPVQGKPAFLSVAVEGGAHSLCRNGAQDRLTLSMHGGWPRVHMGAVEAVYGRSPFYPYLSPLIGEIVSEPPKSLRRLNISLHETIRTMLDVEAAKRPLPQAVLERGREVAEMIDPSLSVIDAIMRLGGETLLGLLSLGQDEA